MNLTLINSLVRVSGRLNKASLSFSARYPIIMPNDHHVTPLLIEYYHRQMGHQGMYSAWTALRQRYWILKGAATVQKVLGKCLFCSRNARPGVQRMADLPKKSQLQINHRFILQRSTISDHSLSEK